MVKKDFPLLKEHKGLVYLDSGATSQKPQQVIDAVADFYSTKNANVHRGIYSLSEDATSVYEGTRETVRAFVNAASTKEIIFTSGTTESINLVAQSLSEIKKVLITSAEHHANIVPWQMSDSELFVVNYDKDFRLDMDEYKKMLSEGVDLVSITHVSNVLGTINPVKELIQLAHDAGAKVLLDGAQAVPHMKVDVQDLDADFYVFSAHKMCGPTGVGVLYAKEALLNDMTPVQGGGDMISSVSFETSNWNELPWKFEAGTPNIAGVIGLGAAIKYLEDIGFEKIAKHEQGLGEYALEKLQEVDGLAVHGPQDMQDRVAVFSFTLKGIHPHDIASVLDEEHVAIRAGHHCAMPLHEKVLTESATARASFYIYNEKEDVDKLVTEIKKVVEIFSKA